MKNSETIELLKQETDISKRTEIFVKWMKSQTDYIKLSYAINWKMVHTLFNVSCNYFNSDVIQNIDWFKIYQNRDLGKWSHQGKVNCI